MAPREFLKNLFDLAKAGITYQDLRLSLLGQHQITNAMVVVATLHLLREQGVTWDEAALREGLADVIWPARVEVLQKNPIVIADGAHTYAMHQGPLSISAVVVLRGSLAVNRSMFFLGGNSRRRLWAHQPVPSPN